jgi:hypothetical protein
MGSDGMNIVFKILGKAGGAALTLAGVVGVAVTAAYWLDLDDKAVAGMVTAMQKGGKLKQMKKMKEAYEADQKAAA